MHCSFLVTWSGLFLLSVSHFVFAAEKKEDEAVVTLTTKNFDAFIKENEFTVVEFYAPWCGHCKKLAPEYEAAAKVLAKDNIKLGKVDATVETELARTYDIGGYPTMKVFRKGVAEEFKGGRTTDAIVQWIKMMTGPTVKIVDTVDEAKTSLKDTAAGFIGKFKNKDSKAYLDYLAAADKFRSVAKFLAVIDDSGDDSVVAHREDEGLSHEIQIKSAELVEKFVDLERFPLFGPINSGNYGEYFQNKRDLIWFIGSLDHFKEVGVVIREAAAHFREKLNFVWLNGEEFKDHAENALGVSEFPAMVLQSGEGRYIYPSHAFDAAKKIIEFITDALGGKLKKHLISENIPEASNETVKVVVGKTLTEVAIESNKNVFLEVYAPWCGHCKQFEPIYEKFAESMKAEPNLIVAKMDGTKNESPDPQFQWTGFPSIFFVKAGSKKPVLYDGPRTVEGLTEYFKEHAAEVSDIVADQKDEL